MSRWFLAQQPQRACAFIESRWPAPQNHIHVSTKSYVGRGVGDVEKQAHGSANDRGGEADEAGRKAEDVAREVGVSAHTIYAWKSKYGGMDVSEAQEAKRLRDENSRLRKLVADLSLDKEALQSVIEKNGWSSQR